MKKPLSSATTALLVALVISQGVTLAQNQNSRTVPGPESKKLLPAEVGYIVMDRPVGGMIAVQLPTLKELVVRPTTSERKQSYPTVHQVSGPDSEGRIAYVDNYMFEERHELKTIRLDGTGDTKLFSRSGDALWDKVIGEHMALAPVGGRVAIISQLANVQMPGALHRVGTLEIWDVNKKTGEKITANVVDSGLSWFPDGKRIAYVKFKDGSGGKAYPGWDKVPSVFVWDFEAGTEKPLGVGKFPIVSADGEQVIVMSDQSGSFRQFSAATGESTAFTSTGLGWARAKSGIIASLSPEVVLSWSLPTTGAKIEFTKSNSPLSGPKQMVALKLVRLNSGEFQTVVPLIDPRRSVSFGRAEKYQGK